MSNYPMTELLEIPSGSNLLTGIVHLPVEPTEARVGVLIASSNLPPKFGPHRLCVSVAQAFSRAGFYALRYDNRGTDDSPGFHDLTFDDRVADARAAMDFFRRRYNLDVTVGWGLCAAASVAVHAGASSRVVNGFDGLILCNLLAHPSAVWDKRVNARVVKVGDLARQMFFSGNLLQKLRQAPSKLGIYRRNVPKLIGGLLERFRRTQPEIPRLRAAIGRVGQLLSQFSGPCLLIFGEKDLAYRFFLERVNPDDQLGLAKKRVPPEWVLIKDGDHSFASREQTDEVIRHTLEWLVRLTGDRCLGSGGTSGRKGHGVSAQSVVD